MIERLRGRSASDPDRRPYDNRPTAKPLPFVALRSENSSILKAESWPEAEELSMARLLGEQALESELEATNPDDLYVPAEPDC